MERKGISEQQLFQVVVTHRGKQIPVGPRVAEPIAREFAATIRKNIIDGKERDWSDPQVMSCSPSPALH